MPKIEGDAELLAQAHRTAAQAMIAVHAAVTVSIKRKDFDRAAELARAESLLGEAMTMVGKARLPKRL